jgi:hypothetical protein
MPPASVSSRFTPVAGRWQLRELAQHLLPGDSEPDLFLR